SPVLAVILVLWIAVHLTSSLFFSRSCAIYEQRHARSRSALLGRIVDSLTNNFAVNLFYRFNYEKRTLAPFQNEERETASFAKRHVEKMRSVSSLFYAALCFIGINGFMIYLWLHNQISTGEAAQVFGTMWNIATTMWNV